MADKEIATLDSTGILEQVVVGGDLSKLTPAQRVNYYARVCESIALNPLTKPFQYITLNGRLTLYATRDCADQLRRRDKVSLTVTAADVIGDLYVVRVKATTGEGRSDEDMGAVNITGLKGDALANATMKALTKAKRRATLSICGLGWLDETEIETVPTAASVAVDIATGEIVEEGSTPIDDGDEDFLVVTCDDCQSQIPAVVVIGNKQYSRTDWLKKCQTKFRADLCLKCSQDRAEVLKQEQAA